MDKDEFDFLADDFMAGLEDFGEPDGLADFIPPEEPADFIPPEEPADFILPEDSAEGDESPESEAPSAEASDEFEIDPRFNIDRRSDGSRRKNYSYNGKSVSSVQEYSYAPKEAPEYEELRSSYGAVDEYGFPVDGPDAYGALFPSAAEDAEEEPPQEEKPGLFSRLKAAKAEKAANAAADEKPPKKKDRFTKEDYFSGEYSDDLAGVMEKEEDYLPYSFKEYLSSRIAGIVLKIRGGAPASAASGTMETEEEDLGPELKPMEASKYYGSQVYSLRLRFRLSCVFLLLMAYISLGLPLPGTLKILRVATAAVLSMQLLIMLLSLDIVSNAFTGAFRLRFGADTLAVLSNLVSIADACMILSGNAGIKHIPLCVLSSLSLVGVLCSSLLSARALRKTLRVPAIAKKTYTVTTEKNVVGKDTTVLKSSLPVDGFLRRAEEMPIDESMFSKLAPFIAALSLVLALAAALITHSLSCFVYIFSVILCPAAPFTALICFALPFFIGSASIFSSGAALAGWSGTVDIGHSKNLIVTDRDLFPEECIEIEKVRIFADYAPDKVITYAGSMILRTACGLAPAFSSLMQENGCSPVNIDNMSFLAGGGIKGMAEGHDVICGNSDLMRLMNVRIPYRLISDTSVLLAIDGVLYGIFAVKYTADPKVRKALVSLMRGTHHPIFAIRDFNITPELIHDVFDVATDGYDFPPYVDRFPISEAQPSKGSQVSALVCREGLGPLTSLADTGRNVFTASRINTVISLASAVAGMLVMFIKLTVTGVVPLSLPLLYEVFTSLPVIVIGFMTNSID